MSLRRVRFSEINALVDRYRAIDAEIRLEEFRSPLNREAEKARLGQAYEDQTVYNPRFRYRAVPSGLEDGLAELRDDIRSDDPWSELLRDTVAKDVTAIRALRQRDPAELTSAAVAAYGSPGSDLVDDARRRLAHGGESSEQRTVDADAAAGSLADAIAGLGLDDWVVEVTPSMNARMSVQGSARRIRVRADAWFTPLDVGRLIVHEIGTHVFRSVNGSRQPLKALAVGLGPYLRTEEGLALWQEESHSLLTGTARHRSALRVVAVAESLRRPLFDVYADLRTYLSHDDAFDTCVRAKRGFVDTAAPGAHTKDHLYDRGHRDVTAHLAANPNDLPVLLVGKVALETIDEVRALLERGVLEPPALTPRSLGAVLPPAAAADGERSGSKSFAGA